MPRPPLEGCNILIVEDVPLIAIDISDAFVDTGANLTTTNTLKHALVLAEHYGLSAAILDHSLSDGETTSLCARLKERGIPFLIYSGYPAPNDDQDVPRLVKPSTHTQLVNAVEALIRDKKSST